MLRARRGAVFPAPGGARCRTIRPEVLQCDDVFAEQTRIGADELSRHNGGSSMRGPTRAMLAIASLTVAAAACTPASVLGGNSAVPTTPPSSLPTTRSPSPRSPTATTAPGSMATTTEAAASKVSTTVNTMPAYRPFHGCVAEDGCVLSHGWRGHDDNDARRSASATPPSPSNRKPLFVHYYLWWDTPHWKSKLGAHIVCVA